MPVGMSASLSNNSALQSYKKTKWENNKGKNRNNYKHLNMYAISSNSQFLIGIKIQCHDDNNFVYYYIMCFHFPMVYFRFEAQI